MPFAQTKIILATTVTAAFLTACASAPKPINLPASTLKASTDSVDKSAIAFQASDGRCNKSGFQISPKLSDGKYGPSERIEISSSTFKLKSKSLTQSKFASSTKQLYVKSMAPGQYVMTRIWCYDSNGTSATTYYTKPERIDIFAEFDVDPGQTNYIGAIQVSKAYSGRAPSLSIDDKSDAARVFFDEHYADKTAPMQTKLAQKTGPMAGLSQLEALMKALQESKAKLAAEEAAKKAAEEAAGAETK